MGANSLEEEREEGKEEEDDDDEEEQGEDTSYLRTYSDRPRRKQPTPLTSFAEEDGAGEEDEDAEDDTYIEVHRGDRVNVQIPKVRSVSLLFELGTGTAFGLTPQRVGF